MVLLMPTLIDGMGEKDTGLEDNGRTFLEPLVYPAFSDISTTAFRASHHMFYKTAVERVEDHLPKFGGKKGEEPMNEAAEKMAKEVEKKNKEKEAKKEEEERASKKQKTDDKKDE
jgi:alpha-galactosidase/6-phospho-beta-glucosidase family protein